MTGAALIALLAAPAALAAALCARPIARAVATLAPMAPLPALAVALGAPDGAIELPWVLLGATLVLDDTARVLLAAAAVLYGAGAVYARAQLARDRLRRFLVLYLAAMTGNLGVAVAGDVASFYALFAVMTFSAYGLVVHARGERAMRAGRVYIVMAVAGEALLLAGLVLAGHLADDLGLAAVRAALAGGGAEATLAVSLLLAGFGVKAGLVGLHMWLPLAHPVAPTAASAVLSGAMIKAGLAGWMRFLPLGEGRAGTLAAVCVALGLGGALLGVAVGVLQADPKTLLAYSSVSQMGLMLALVGVAAAGPGAAAQALPALGLFALHHGLAKASLFLGVGVTAAAGGGSRALALAGMALPALALAGAPLTSGAMTKTAALDAAGAAGGAWATALALALPLSSAGTALLLARLMVILARTGPGASPPPAGMWTPWGALVALGLTSPWWAPAVLPLGALTAGAPTLYALWSGLWPLALGVALLAGATAAWRRAGRRAPAVPPGDLLAPALALGTALRRPAGRGLAGVRARAGRARPPRVAVAVRAAASRGAVAALAGAERWGTGALAMLVLALVLLAALAGGGR